MKGLVIGLAGLCSLVVLTPSRTAHAQVSHRVVIEPFFGPSGSTFREQTIAALVQLGQQIVPDKSVTAAVTSLGLRQVWDNHAGVSQQVQATLFVGGAVVRKGGRYVGVLKAKDSNGGLVGQGTWSAGSSSSLLSRIRSGLNAQLEIILNGGKTGDLAAADQVGQAPVPVAEGAESEEALLQRRAQGIDESDMMGSGGMERRQGNTLDFSAGAHLYSRRFAYLQNRVGGQQGYSLSGVPAPMLALDYFVLPFLGVTVGGEYSVALVTQDPNGNRLDTGSFGYWAGLKGRYSFDTVDALASLAYGENSFTVGNPTGAPDVPEVADVRYRQLKAGLSTRVAIGNRLSVLAGGDYLHLLSFGGIKSASFFPQMTGYGFETFAGMALGVLGGFEARATANLRRYVFSMNTTPGASREVGGAIDQYLGLNLIVAYRN